MSETPFGYHGRYLRVDLTTRKTESISIPSDVLRNYIGGSGLGTWLLLEETNGSPDALAAESSLIFVFSPLVGSPLTTSAKFAVLAKSPLTERINDSLSSSSFAIAGKKTGYDAFVITGAAESPTCLVIEPETIRFEDARATWGKTISHTADIIHKQLGPGYQLATIGPAGENLVRFATISHDGRHAGRGGHGAVMGSKNLKAVAVRGDRLTAFAHPKQLYTYSKQLSKKSFGPATAKYRELGTVSNLLVFNRLGTLPTRNFQSGTFEHAIALSPEVMGESHTRTRASCAACTIGCEHIFQLSPSTDSGTAEIGVRMEYESLFALGSLCGVAEAEIVLQSSKFCDEWGMDTISSGASIAFAMECAERGLIDAPELRFGNGQAMLEALKAIGSRCGLGELLSLGSRAAAREIGQGSEDFAPHVKGLEIPGYEPRAMQTMALGFAVGTRGADHNRSGAYQVDFSDAVDRMHVGPEAVPFAIETEDESAMMDSLILCKFLRSVFDDKLAGMAEMLDLVTGWETTAAELRKTAQRIVTAKKWYNIQQGWTPCEDTLPARFLSEPLTDGANAEATLTKDTLCSLIETYNLARGWSADGWVYEQQIAELGLGRS
jgi:aldehyde:ferredoxin oxidoreductase